MENLSDKNYWDNEWQIEERDYKKFQFAEIIEEYIPKSGTYFEVGCAPGSIMCYFNKVLGYQVSGIDYSSPEIVRQYLENHDVKDYRLYHDDFTTFKTNEKFDVVASYGFVEHFDKYYDIIDRHKKLVKDDGYLIIEMPNLRFFNWIIYRLFNYKLLKMHNLEIMKIKKLREAMGDDFKIMYLDYYKTSFFSFNDENAELDRYPLIKKTFVLIKKMMEKLKIDNVPNRFFSPYIILIAKKQ